MDIGFGLLGVHLLAACSMQIILFYLRLPSLPAFLQKCQKKKQEKAHPLHHALDSAGRQHTTFE